MSISIRGAWPLVTLLDLEPALRRLQEQAPRFHGLVSGVLDLTYISEQEAWCTTSNIDMAGTPDLVALACRLIPEALPVQPPSGGGYKGNGLKLEGDRKARWQFASYPVGD